MREHLLELSEEYGLGLHLIAGGGIHEVHRGAHRSRTPACAGKTEEEQQQRAQKWRGRPTPGAGLVVPRAWAPGPTPLHARRAGVAAAVEHGCSRCS